MITQLDGDVDRLIRRFVVVSWPPFGGLLTLLTSKSDECVVKLTFGKSKIQLKSSAERQVLALTIGVRFLSSKLKLCRVSIPITVVFDSLRISWL